MPIIYSGELSQRRLFFFTKCHMVIPRMVLNIMEPKIWATFQFKTLYSEFHPSNWLAGVTVWAYPCMHHLNRNPYFEKSQLFMRWWVFEILSMTYVVFGGFLYDSINCVNSAVAMKVDIVILKRQFYFYSISIFYQY